MRPETLLDVLDASHLTHYVDSPFHARNGIMLISAPGTFKTTLITTAFETYSDALVLSDINVQQLIGLRNDIANHRYRTLAFTELEKLYQRHSATAVNIEGHLKAMVEEGLRVASFEDSRMFSVRSQCMVVGAMTFDCYARHFKEWQENGFARRFLWSMLHVQNMEKLTEAIHKWQLLKFGEITRRYPGNNRIEYDVSARESNELEVMCKHQPGFHSQFVYLKKIFAVLKWKYRQSTKALEIIRDFRPALQKDGAYLVLK